MIDIKKLTGNTYEVRIDAPTKTVHEVTIPEGYYSRLTANQMRPDELIKRSFEFLLERESNTMIFRKFELSVISNYFPEYESVIKGGMSE